LRKPSEPIHIRPYVSFNTAFETGLTPVGLNSSGEIPKEAAVGAEMDVGLYGFYRWKTATLGIDYRGNYRNYASNTYYNGTDQALSLIYNKRAGHLSYTVRESAGIVSRTLFSTSGFEFLDSNSGTTPNNELFDGRTIYLDTMADVTYSKSARL